MKKWSVAFGGLAFISAAWAGPVLRWDGTETIPQFRRFDAAGKQDQAVPAAVRDVETGRFRYVFDGRSLLAVSHKLNGAQTLRVQVRFKAPPQGVLLARNRPAEGARGFEFGFSARHHSDFMGNAPAGFISDGYARGIVGILGTGIECRPGVRYEYIVRFEPGKFCAVTVIDRSSGEIVYGGSVPCPAVGALAEKAGNRLLCVGGRRSHSRLCEYLVPEGTEIFGITVWDRALTIPELRRELGLPEGSAVKEHSAAVRFVDPVSGDDANAGISPEKPFRSIGRAVAAAAPGDTVKLAPGIYFEQVNILKGGTPEAPLTIQGDPAAPGKVIVTGAVREIREGKVKWKLEDEQARIYSVPLAERPVRVLYDGVNLPAGDTLKSLREMMTTGEPRMPLPFHGHYYDTESKKLYVRLHIGGKYGSRDPNEHVMSVASRCWAGGFNGRAGYQPKDSNFFVKTGDRAGLVIDGITFETPGTAAVVAVRSGGIVVRNCVFSGCRWAVAGSGTDDVFVENCLYQLKDLWGEAKELIGKRKPDPQDPAWYSKWQWLPKHVSDYTKNHETGVFLNAGKRWHLRNSIIENAFDGLSCFSMDRAEDTQIYGNRFEKLLDNAIEVENHAKNVRIYNNVFIDMPDPISDQPLGGLPWPGPVFVYRNIFYENPESKEVRTVRSHGAFKFGANWLNWERIREMGNGAPDAETRTRISKRFLFAPYPGFLVFNNTIDLPDHCLINRVQRRYMEFVNFRFFNNIISCREILWETPGYQGLLEFFNNLEVAPKENGVIAGAGGKKLASLDGTVFDRPGDRRYELRRDSAAAGLGTLLIGEIDASEDAGAVSRGQRWSAGEGPGKAPEPARLSPFARKVLYEPALVRAAGPVAGRWGVYAPEERCRVAVPAGTVPESGTVEIIFCAAAFGETEVLAGCGDFSLTLAGDGAGRTVTASGGVVLPAGTDRESWRTLTLKLDGRNASLALDGAPARRLPSRPAAGETIFVNVGRNPVFDVLISETPGVL